MRKISEEKEPLIPGAKLDNPTFKEKLHRCASHRWTSLGVVYVVNFLEIIQNSFYWSSLWPFFSSIDPSATESFFGVVVMSVSLASAISSPLFGYWSNKIQQTRLPIITGIFINVIGNGLLAFVEAFPGPATNRKWILLSARAVTGLGMGNYGAMFAYVAMASTAEERNSAVSLRAAVNSVGLLLGPGMQIAFVPLGYPGIVKGPFHFNMYTVPAFINMILGAVEIVILSTVFRENWVSVKEGKIDQKTNEEVILKPYDKVAVAVCIYARIACLFCFTYDTTIGSPFTITMFNWTNTEAVTYNGAIQMVAGVFHLIGNLVVGNFVLKRVKERVVIVVGLTSMAFYYIFSFSYPGEPPLLDPLANATEQTCNYVWCSYTTRIYFWQYILAYIFLIPAFSVAYVPNATLFTKVVGPRKQGTLQGMFAAGGQLATAASPIVCSSLFQFYGPRVTWVVGIVVSLSSAVVVLAAFKRLVPYEEDAELSPTRIRRFSLLSHASVIEENLPDK